MCCAGGGIWKCGSITLRGDFCPFKCDTYLWMPWWHAWCGFWANLTEEAAVKAFGNTHCHRPAENTEGAIVCCIYCMAVGASRSVYTKRERERERGGEACESLLALNSEFRAQYIIVSQMLYWSCNGICSRTMTWHCYAPIPWQISCYTDPCGQVVKSEDAVPHAATCGKTWWPFVANQMQLSLAQPASQTLSHALYQLLS